MPDNLQREDIDIEKLDKYCPEEDIQNIDLDQIIENCLTLINNSKRPVLILGWGVRLSKADNEIMILIEKLGIPVLPTWAMRDFLPNEHALLIGPFGTHGTRYGNFAVQNADLVISIGARLDTRAAGSPLPTFAREAKKIIIDIDQNELNKFEKLGMKADILINADARDFARAFKNKTPFGRI